jgi:quinol monooxygenase YgiN
MADDSFRILIRMRIQPGQRDAFTRLIRELTARVEAEEPGMRAYEWYLSPDGTECYFHEWLASSEAFLAHVAHVGPSLPALQAAAPPGQTLVFGQPSAQAKALLESFGAQYFPRVDGFAR